MPALLAKRTFQLLTFLSLSSCLQTENSSSLDEFVGGGGTVKPIFSSACASCHDHGKFLQMSDEDFVTQGLVIPGNAEGSKMYYRLAGSTGPNGPKDMPQGGALSANELEEIKLWIESIEVN